MVGGLFNVGRSLDALRKTKNTDQIVLWSPSSLRKMREKSFYVSGSYKYLFSSFGLFINVFFSFLLFFSVKLSLTITYKVIIFLLFVSNLIL